MEQDDETGKYRLGLVVIRLAEKAERTLDLRGIATPELERLARLTHETTGLGILDGDTLLTVAQVDGPNLIAVGDWTGRATPLHCVASGKVLLSSLAEREVLRIVRRGLVSYTERTDRRAGAAARGAGPDPPARLRDGDRGVRAGVERGLGTRPRRARQRDRGRRHLGPGLPADPAPRPGAGRPGPRGRGGHLGPPRRHRPRPNTRPGARHGLSRQRRPAPARTPLPRARGPASAPRSASDTRSRQPPRGRISRRHPVASWAIGRARSSRSRVSC